MTDEVLEPLGHDWIEGTVLQEATLESEGLMQYICRRCGEEKAESIPKTQVADAPITLLDPVPETQTA